MGTFTQIRVSLDTVEYYYLNAIQSVFSQVFDRELNHSELLRILIAKEFGMVTPLLKDNLKLNGKNLSIIRENIRKNITEWINNDNLDLAKNLIDDNVEKRPHGKLQVQNLNVIERLQKIKNDAKI